MHEIIPKVFSQLYILMISPQRHGRGLDCFSVVLVVVAFVLEMCFWLCFIFIASSCSHKVLFAIHEIHCFTF